MHIFYSGLLAILILTSHITEAMNNKKAQKQASPNLPLEIVKQTVIGGIAGGVEVTCNQGLMTIKNRFQQKKPFTINPSILYKGYLGNASSMGPTTAVQFSAYKLITNAFSEKGKREISLAQRICASSIAGGLSGLISSPTEKIIIEQQAHKISWLDAYKKVLKTGGIALLYKGLTPVMFRDGGFAVGYQVLGSHIVELLNLKDQHILIKASAGGVPAGIIAGLITHPFDTASTCMKSMDKKTTTLRILQNMYKQGGIQEWYAGSIARSTRVCLAIIVLTYVTNELETLFKNI